MEKFHQNLRYFFGRWVVLHAHNTPDRQFSDSAAAAAAATAQRRGGVRRKKKVRQKVLIKRKLRFSLRGSPSLLAGGRDSCFLEEMFRGREEGGGV